MSKNETIDLCIKEIRRYFANVMSELPTAEDEDGDMYYIDTSEVNKLLTYNKGIASRLRNLKEEEKVSKRFLDRFKGDK